MDKHVCTGGDCSRLWEISDNLSKVAVAMASIAGDVKHALVTIDEHGKQLKEHKTVIESLTLSKVQLLGWVGGASTMVFALFELIKTKLKLFGG